MWHLDSRMNSLTGLYTSLIEVKHDNNLQPCCFLQNHFIGQVVYSLLGLHSSFETEGDVMVIPVCFTVCELYKWDLNVVTEEHERR